MFVKEKVSIQVKIQTRRKKVQNYTKGL